MRAAAQTRRRLHSIFAIGGITALISGSVVFDWSWSVAFPLREKLFVLHRGAGMVAGVAILIWVVGFCPRQHSFVHGKERQMFVRLYQSGLAILLAATAFCAWVGRALGGRWIELVWPLPIYNFVSRPDIPLAHALLALHAELANIILITVTIHAAFAAIHWVRERRNKVGDM